MSITAKKCAELIRKKFKPTDKIILYNENPKPPYDEGWVIDTAEHVIANLIDPEVFFPDDTQYNFTVGLIKINTGEDKWENQ